MANNSLQPILQGVWPGLKVASNLLIIRTQSPGWDLFTLTRKTLSCLSAGSWISSALSHQHFSCMVLSFVWSSLCLLLYTVLFDADDRFSTVLCERCTSPEVLCNCRITLISSILMFSNFFLPWGLVWGMAQDIPEDFWTVLLKFFRASHRKLLIKQIFGDECLFSAQFPLQ